MSTLDLRQLNMLPRWRNICYKHAWSLHAETCRRVHEADLQDKETEISQIASTRYHNMGHY